MAGEGARGNFFEHAEQVYIAPDYRAQCSSLHPGLSENIPPKIRVFPTSKWYYVHRTKCLSNMCRSLSFAEIGFCMPSHQQRHCGCKRYPGPPCPCLGGVCRCTNHWSPDLLGTKSPPCAIDCPGDVLPHECLYHTLSASPSLGC